MALAVIGMALLGTSLAHPWAGWPRTARLAGSLGGAAVLVVGAAWLVASQLVWRGVAGPWWAGIDEQRGQLDAVRALLLRLGPAHRRWTRPCLRTARALQSDNVALCSRMDRMALLASRHPGKRASTAEALAPMWKSLADGRERHLQLCGEMRAMAGSVMAAAPLLAPPSDGGMVDRLGDLADRLRVLDSARRELMAGAALPNPTTAVREPGRDPAVEAVELLRARAPDLVPLAGELFEESSRRLADSAEFMRRWRLEVAGLPAETPAVSRDAFVAGRQQAISEAETYMGRIVAAELSVARAARALVPLPVPPPAGPPSYNRPSVEEAGGMIAALRELRRGLDRRPMNPGTGPRRNDRPEAPPGTSTTDS